MSPARLAARRSRLDRECSVLVGSPLLRRSRPRHFTGSEVVTPGSRMDTGITGARAGRGPVVGRQGQVPDPVLLAVLLPVVLGR
jgi:hypothetical protein